MICGRLLLTLIRLSDWPAAQSEHLREVEDELLRLVPAEARIRDGLAVRALADLLVTVLDVTLNHEALDERADIRRDLAAVDDILRDADLLEILLARVRMIRVDDDSRVHKIALVVCLAERAQVLVVVVRQTVAEAVDITAQDGMRQRVALRADFPAAEQELLRVLCRFNRVEHDRDITDVGFFMPTGMPMPLAIMRWN